MKLAWPVRDPAHTLHIAQRQNYQYKFRPHISQGDAKKKSTDYLKNVTMVQ